MSLELLTRRKLELQEQEAEGRIERLQAALYREQKELSEIRRLLATKRETRDPTIEKDDCG